MKVLKLPTLNESLVPGELHPVLFLFNAISIPINDQGEVVKPEEAANAHYASLVYDCKDEQWALVEYPKHIWHALKGYRQRHERLDDLRILLSRYESDNRFKMSLGNVNQRGFPFGRPEYDFYKESVHSKLYEKYMSKLGYKVHDAVLSDDK